MGDSYKNLLKRYNRIGLDISSKFVLLIDGRKQNFDEYVKMDLRYIKVTTEYIATLKIDEVVGLNTLEFVLSNKDHSKCLLSYILDVLTSENKCFYKTINSIIINDYHTEILDIKRLTINNALVDSKMLKILSEQFKNLKLIDFIKCRILEDCEFNVLDSNLNFYDCEIENINSFNYCKQPLMFQNSKVIKIVNSIVNSSIIKINGLLDDSTLERLFLLCHFPDLKNLIIGNNIVPYEVDKTAYFDKSLLFLPYACPNLESLFIEGKITSFNFLYHCSNLKECEIRSVDDSISYFEIYTPYITDNEERDKIINSSNRNINDDMGIHLSMLDKMNMILEMLRLVGFSQEEIQIYIKQQSPTILLNPIKEFSEKSIEHFYLYDLCNKTLKLCTQDDDSIEMTIISDKFYEIKKQFIGKNIRTKQNIIAAKPFVYHPSGIPISFDNDGYNYHQYIDRAIELKDMFILDEDYQKTKLK